ncbi:MAG: hypothetical protein JW731_10400, partial [Bacteroidales bacterium]|nr:hypothetical protein [Bacteroidales bacterium]
MPELYAKNRQKLFNQTITKINRFIAGLLTLIFIGNHLGYLPIQKYIIQRALAETDEPVFELENPPEKDRDQLGLITLLVEENLLDDFDLRSRIMTYADSVQQRIPHSKAFIMEVNSNESTFRIASILEKLYFEGIDTDLIDGNPFNNNPTKEDDNQLTGVIIIGNVPIPVVHENNGLASPSLYPYTDFYRKAYIFDHTSGRFLKNDAVSAPTPEVWHGVIVPPGKDPNKAKAQLIEYFDKNYEYTSGNLDYTDFEKRILYANFPEMEKQMNYMDYKNYLRYLKYMEEFIMYRYNKHLLKEIIDEVSADMGSPDTPIMDEETINTFYDAYTETIFKKYAYNFAQALNIYRSGINDMIGATGRWTPAEVDSPESLITMRDEFAKNYLKRQQLVLEKEINDLITNNLSTNSRQENITTLARLNIKLKILDLQVDNNTFNFYSYFDGQRASNITNASQCGIEVGQRKQDNQSVLENNSVLVRANRMYNPATQLTNPDRDEDWDIEEDSAYETYAGCVFDNAIPLPQTGRHPNKCVPEKAEASIYDILGAIEVPEGQETNSATRCDVSNMTFRLLDEDQYDSSAADGFVPDVAFSQSLEEVIDEVYTMLGGEDVDAETLNKGSFVIKQLIATGEGLTYTPEEDVEIQISVSTQSKPVDTTYSHVEPTNETIRAIKHIGEPRVDPTTGAVNLPAITTPSTPADGIRYISFVHNGVRKAINYLNLFRITGNNANEVTRSLILKFNSKQNELSQATGVQSNLFNDFYTQRPELIEPIIWKASSIDQKLAEIIPKYVDRDSFMPSPYYIPKKSPQNKPDGYEVLHIVADGDTRGYQFGLNRAMLKRAPSIEGAVEEEEEEVDLGTGTAGPALGEAEEEGGAATDEGHYLCGDPSGVEIWEWFDALQCWINEEILPAEELFQLSNACTSAPIPPEEEEEEGDIFDELLSTASDFNVSMKRKSLVANQEVQQEERITVSALNERGEPVLGYIDMPVHFELTNATIGEFSDNDIYIYTGERGIDFTARRTGSSNLTISMEGLPDKTRSFEIDVFDHIDMDWDTQEEIRNGRSEFTISVALKNPNGGAITNINDTIQLAPLQPADGGFENNGQLRLTNGRGTIKFLPAPGKESITLTSKDPYITGQTIIEPTAAPATQILIHSDPYIPIGTQKQVQIIAANDFGLPSTNFNKKINVRLSDESKKYASLASSEVTMVNGVGTVKVNGGRETADITLMAEHEDLKDAQIDIPLLARVDSDTWQETYPQNLFASFVGFPAGNFFEEDYFGGTHLFEGKTEAVYSFLNAPIPEPTLIIAPNHVITTTERNQTVYVDFPGNPGNEILLQPFDHATMQTLFSKKASLNLNEIERYEG